MKSPGEQMSAALLETPERRRFDVVLERKAILTVPATARDRSGRRSRSGAAAPAPVDHSRRDDRRLLDYLSSRDLDYQ